MPLTRRVQVFISEEASAALDRLSDIHGGQTRAIEAALLAVDRLNAGAVEQTDTQTDSKPANKPKRVKGPKLVETRKESRIAKPNASGGDFSQYDTAPEPSTYCPRHAPKFCEPDCKSRVSV
jgi:hypothetical protein